jgi:hypothetical protein
MVTTPIFTIFSGNIPYDDRIGRMQRSRKFPSHTSLERPRRVELRSRTAAFESARIKSYKPSKFADCCLNGYMGVWEAGSPDGAFLVWISGRKKIMLIWDAERSPQAKFQLPNMFCSREIKSQKSPIICMGKWFCIDVFPSLWTKTYLPYKW